MPFFLAFACGGLTALKLMKFPPIGLLFAVLGLSLKFGFMTGFLLLFLAILFFISVSLMSQLSSHRAHTAPPSKVR